MKTILQHHHPGRALRWWDLGILAICVFTLLAVLFPVFAKPRRNRQIFVFDANGKPVPHARLTFRTSSGFAPNYMVTTDEFGRSYDRRATDIAQNVVGEYALQNVQRNTGRKDWVFSTRGTQAFVVRDEKGEILPDSVLYLSHPSRRYGGLSHRPDQSLLQQSYHTDQNGSVTFPNIGLSQRFEPSIEDKRYVVESVRITTGKDWVNYDVRVAKPAMVTGIVATAEGNAMEHMVVSAHLIPKNGQSHPLVATHTHANGRFQLQGLPPGEYELRVGERLPNLLSSSQPVATINVRSDETKQVKLPFP